MTPGVDLKKEELKCDPGVDKNSDVISTQSEIRIQMIIINKGPDSWQITLSCLKIPSLIELGLIT